MGPICAVPWMSAGGAVFDPLPSFWVMTFGYCFLHPSHHSVMTLTRRSGPSEFKLPEIPLTLVYGLISESIGIACANATVCNANATAETRAIFSDFSMTPSSLSVLVLNSGWNHCFV